MVKTQSKFQEHCLQHVYNDIKYLLLNQASISNACLIGSVILLCVATGNVQGWSKPQAYSASSRNLRYAQCHINKKETVLHPECIIKNGKKKWFFDVKTRSYAPNGDWEVIPFR